MVNLKSHHITLGVDNVQAMGDWVEQHWTSLWEMNSYARLHCPGIYNVKLHSVIDNMDIVVVVYYKQGQERDLTRFLLKYG
jgi:hypothetical protein